MERAWLRRHPPLRELNQENRAAWVSARLELPKGDAWRILYAAPRDDADLLKRLWAGLTAGPCRAG